MQRNSRRYNRTYDNGTPKEWRNFVKLRFKVSNIPINVGALELRGVFSDHGSVHKVEIETTDDNRSKGIAYVTFKPVPSLPFWTKQIRIDRKPLKVDYYDHSSITFIDKSDGRSKLKSYTFPAESLEMGVYLSPNTFVSEFKYTKFVNFTINYQKRHIVVEFGVPGAQQHHLFKLEIAFKDIDDEFHVVVDDSQERSYASITVSNKFPARYWVLDGRLQSKDDYNWCFDDSWKRKTEIRVSPKSKEMREIPLQPHMPDNSEQLGKCVVYRITFNLDQIVDVPEHGVRTFIDMIKKAREYNLVSKHINADNIDKTKPLNTINGANLRKCIDRSSIQNFELLYMIESIISFNYIHDYNINEDFFLLLSKQKTQFAIRLLEKIYARKERIYEPLSYLCSELKAVKPGDINNIKPKHVPSHCVMMRKVVITPTTMYILPPALETSNRVIRRFRNKKDNFLRIQFVDEASNKVNSSNGTHNFALCNRIYNTLYYGLKIGDRHYEFLAFSSSQLRDHSCWFYASTHDSTANDIRNWMGDFSSIKNVAKYAARMGQCFSSTRAIQDLPMNDIEEISDIVMNGYTFSDGIGKLSFSLASKIAEELELKNIPSAFQFRLGGYKGILCQSRYVRGNQIQVRPSQHKFVSDHNILEVIRCSTFIPAYLNRQAITLLTSLGVPERVFIEMSNSQINELNKICESDNTAIKLLQKNVDEHGISKYMAELVKAGFLQKKDRYLMNLISLFRIAMLRDLKKKAKIRVEKGAFLIGVLDETQSLRDDEIYCCISDPNGTNGRKVITGTCVVFRNPCFHPGDIRVVTAVNCKSLDNLLDVVVFPAAGFRDIPGQCSGGDLDGDDFTIIYDERLIPKEKNLEPMCHEVQKPDIVDNVTIKDIQSFFVNYILSDHLGKIANSHLAKSDYFDSGAFHGQCIRLAQLHSQAVDFPKTGKPAIFPLELRAEVFPDFMEKPDKSSYESQKVLGVLYRSIKEEEFIPCNNMSLDERLFVEGYNIYVKDARKFKREYDADVMGLMNQFGVKTEFEVTSGYIINTVTNVDRKKSRDITKSVMDAFIPIRRHYRKIFEEEFYGEGTNIISPEARNQMKAKASAWYYVTYHPSELRCDPSESMISFPWIAHDVLCDIALKRNNNNNVNERNRSVGSQKTTVKRINNNTIRISLSSDNDKERLKKKTSQG